MSQALSHLAVKLLTMTAGMTFGSFGDAAQLMHAGKHAGVLTYQTGRLQS